MRLFSIFWIYFIQVCNRFNSVGQTYYLNPKMTHTNWNWIVGQDWESHWLTCPNTSPRSWGINSVWFCGGAKRLGRTRDSEESNNKTFQYWSKRSYRKMIWLQANSLVLRIVVATKIMNTRGFWFYPRICKKPKKIWLIFTISQICNAQS